jgi:hypothetical protein
MRHDLETETHHHVSQFIGHKIELRRDDVVAHGVRIGGVAID